MSTANPPAPPPPAPGPGGINITVKKASSLPLVSLITGLLSFLCLPIILAIVAIITGFMGRKKARAEGNGTGMATAGIILGFLNILFSIIGAIVFFVFLGGVIGTVQDQVKIAETLQNAQISADAYGRANDTFSGITTEALGNYGYTPPADVEVKAVPESSGAAYCIQGNLRGSDDVIHVPADGVEFTITLNDREYKYSSGPCP